MRNFSIPAILEKKLQNENLNVKVINAGIPGAHSRSELYYLENYILLLKSPLFYKFFTTICEM